MIREITIGRERQCDIVLGAECQYASGIHATIYVDGYQLMYRDKSRNGSMVNNYMVHQRAVPIQYGDSIMIAGRYPLSWNQINRYFSHNMYSANSNPLNVITSGPSSNGYIHQEPLPKLGWNWGAFSLYPLWGFWNGCWWAFLVALFFGWTAIPSVLFGAMGSKWAWNNKTWTDATEFNEMQEAWRPWGIFFFVLSIVSYMFLILSFEAMWFAFLY